MDGGTDLMALRPAMTMTGSVIRASVSPPTSGADRGMCMKLRNTARPSRPKMIEGTAARLLIETSIMRSEEHTSELQSLMRISYAVFCLKKKKHNNTKQNNQHI